MNGKVKAEISHTDWKAQADAQHDRDITYAFAYCEASIVQFSRSSGIPFPTIAAKVADLLYLSSGREPMGVVQEMSTVRPGSTDRTERLPKVAVASGAYGRGARRVKIGRPKGKVGKRGKGRGRMMASGSVEPVVIQTLREAQASMSPIEIVRRTGMKSQSVNSVLLRLRGRHEVIREKKGKATLYRLVA